MIDPTIGRIVHYILTEQDAKTINTWRGFGTHEFESSDQRHQGNSVYAGEHLPLIVTALWKNEYPNEGSGVNGQVLLDGNDSLWVTSIIHDETLNHGTWHWPERDPSEDTNSHDTSVDV